MRSSSAVLVTFLVVVGCSSAADLPLGGPYVGGTMPAAGTDGGASFVPGSDGGIVIVTPGIDSGVVTPPPGVDSGVVIPPNVDSGGVTNPGSGAGSGTGTGTNPGTGTGSGTGTSAGTGTGSGTGTGTGTPAPTWTYLYDTYLSSATSTPGDCDGSCHHHSQCGSASACFSWIGSGQQGALTGTGGNSLFLWDSSTGGWMPKSGPTSNPQADADFTAWIAAGSQDN